MECRFTFTVPHSRCVCDFALPSLVAFVVAADVDLPSGSSRTSSMRAAKLGAGEKSVRKRSFFRGVVVELMVSAEPLHSTLN